MRKVNENIALAKSILKKNNIEESNEDYLKIREIVGNSFSYVGILTRLRFVDNVTDMEELKSIFEVLKNSKLDLGKLNKMSYDQILDLFYDTLTTPSSSKDYELVYKDSTYSFFRVHTYKGILEVGSPAWCLKTKSNWDMYQAKYPEQWVAIDNRWVKSILTPNNYYLGTTQYVNKGKRWVRFGVSIKHNRDEHTFSYVAHDDNDGKCSIDTNSHTFYGVLFTILNLSNGNKKSYYQKFLGTEYIKDGIFKVINNNLWTDRLDVQAPKLETGDEYYLFLSKTYSYFPMVLCLKERRVPCLRVFSNNPNVFSLVPISNSGITYELINNFEGKNVAFIGLLIRNGKATIEEAKIKEIFVLQVDKWLVFDWNDDYYIVVDSNPTEFTIPSIDIKGNTSWVLKGDAKPSFYFVIKETIENSYIILDTPESKEIIRQLKNMKNGIKSTQSIEPIETTEPTQPIEPEKKPGFIKRFFGFK